MRIELQFVLAKREIDIEYRRILLHFIKKSFSEVNGGTYYKNIIAVMIQRILHLQSNFLIRFLR